MEKNLYRKITATDIARVAGYSVHHLNEGFVQQTGMSLIRYIRLRKLTQAASILYFTTQSVTEIAHHLAFSSLQSFSRAFRRHFGHSPLAHRQTGKWDLRNTLPSPARRTFEYTCRIACLAGLALRPLHRKKITLPLKNSLILSDQGDLRDEMYHLITGTLFRHNPVPEFAILATLSARQKHQVMFLTTTGIPVSAETPDAIPVPPVQHLCYEFTGTLKEIIMFNQWLITHELKNQGVTVNLSSTFTTYKKHDGHQGRYTITCCLPVLSGPQYRHTRRNREALLAV